MDGRATPTIETSSPSRKSTPHSTTSKAQVRASQRGAAEWVGEEAMAGILHAIANISTTRDAIANVARDWYNTAVMAAVRDREAELGVEVWHALLDRYARTMS